MSNFFCGKKALVAGRGVSGTGAKEALLKLGACVTSYCDGEVFVDENYDLIVLSPSFEKTHFLYKYAKEHKIYILGEYALGCMLNLKPLISVTGTNGKTTVVSLLGDIFSQEKKVAVCGNIGASFASYAVESDYDVAISEVSSFQLEQTEYMRPNIAVITNVTPDHLLRHKSMEEYAKIKFSITAHQTSEDWLVLPYDDSLYDLQYLCTNARIIYVSNKQKVDGAYLKDGKIYFFNEELFSLPKLEFTQYPHNVTNLLFAVAVSKLYGISNGSILRAINSFSPLSHRITLVDRINGVNFYDDSKSTNIDSVLKALDCMKGDTALILGGSEKGLIYDELFKKLNNVIKICVIGEISDALVNTANAYGFYDVQKFETLEKAVVNAFLISPNNVLLSPGSASYDMFSSYAERGDKFREIVKRIANGKI